MIRSRPTAPRRPAMLHGRPLAAKTLNHPCRSDLSYQKICQKPPYGTKGNRPTHVFQHPRPFVAQPRISPITFLPASPIICGNQEGLGKNLNLKVGRMKTELCSSQLYHACHVLFGSGIDVSADFLRYIRMPGLKAVYWERALETHPDRAITLSRPPADLEERFKEVNAAYRQGRKGKLSNTALF